MAENLSISAGISSRYSTALFELMLEEGMLEVLEREIVALQQVIKDSEDLRVLIASPIYTRDDARRGIVEIATRMGLSNLFTNTLALLATKRRLFALPLILEQLEKMISEHKGIVPAEILSAHELSDDELDKITEALKQKAGKDIKLEVKFDPSLIGGMVVRLGSRMIDSSIKSKLMNMKYAMQEVE